jgi:hypothetical protein
MIRSVAKGSGNAGAFFLAVASQKCLSTAAFDLLSFTPSLEVRLQS